MNNILCISYSPIERDARVLRQIAVLREYGEVTTVGYGDKPDIADHHIKIPDNKKSLPQTISGVIKLILRKFKRVELKSPAEKFALGKLHNLQFDLVVANDARALPLAFSIDSGEKIYADLHEWAPEENISNFAWRLLVAPYMEYLCRKYLPKARSITTVNQSLAGLYWKHFGVKASVVRNAIPFQKLTPSTLEPNRIRLVHSGIAVPDRNIESLIDAVQQLDNRFSLDLYLISNNDPKYYESLKTMAKGEQRVTFHDAVLPHELPPVLNKYDLGVFLLPPKSLNHRFMLPNKFFDFVQARLGILMGPAKETSALIKAHNLGPELLDHSTAELTRVLSQITEEDVQRFKANAHHSAEELSSKTDQENTRILINRVLKT